MASRSSFPQYKGGDVEIHLTETDEAYILHRHTLTVASTWFEAALDERWNNSSENGVFASATAGQPRWVYELRFDKDSDVGLLARKGSTNTADTEMMRSTEDTTETLAANEAAPTESRHLIVQAHRNMLAIIHHRSPAFRGFLFYEAISSISALAEVAKTYGCEEVGTIHIDRFLSKHRSAILFRCSLLPLSMLELAVNLKSDWIFHEAATFLLGLHRDDWELHKPELVKLGVIELFEMKRKAFVDVLMRTDIGLLSLQPWDDEEMFSTSRSAAVSIFRQWLVDKMGRADGGSRLGRRYAFIYRKIGDQDLGDHPLDHNEFIYHYLGKIYPEFTADMESDVGDCIKELLADAAEMVEDVLVDHTLLQESNLDDDRPLLFMTIMPEELPWV